MDLNFGIPLNMAVQESPVCPAFPLWFLVSCPGGHGEFKVAHSALTWPNMA